MTFRGYQKIPYPLGTPEWYSFLNFAKAYYKHVIHLAKETSIDHESYQALLQATISPLVYLWEQWNIMPTEKKLPYATQEYAQILQKIRQEAQKIVEQAYGEKKQ